MNKRIDKQKIIYEVLKSLSKSSDFELSIDEVAKKLKFDRQTNRKVLLDIFPEGLDSLIYELSLLVNQEMKDEKKPRNFKNFKFNEKIKYFIFRRIKILNILFDKRILLSLILNQKAPLKLSKMLFGVSDEIMFLSGDKSTDFNYYSKRLILMKIYTLSFLFNLKDKSENFRDTKIFIDKQINSVLMFGRIKSKIRDIFYTNTM
jgi:rpsU-divergently transcribed protein